MKKALQTKWRALGQRFDAKTRRERTMIAAAAVVGVALVGNALLIDPILIRSRQLQRQIDQQRVEASTLTEQAALLTAQVGADPDAPKKERLARLRHDLKALESELNTLAVGFIPPERMNALLEQLLAGHPRLRLVSLKSLPPENLFEPARPPATGREGEGEAAAAAANAASREAASRVGLFRHGAELELEGTYADLHAWLSQIEAAEQKLLWGDVRMTVIEHPRTRMTLSVHTLSTNRSWLAI